MMISMTALWLPILLAAVGVFVVSSVIHMLLPYHRGDFAALPDEDRAMETMRGLAIPPGDYMMPRCTSAKEMGKPEFLAKMQAGPIAFMTVMPNGQMGMGSSLVQWFLYSVVIGVFCAWLATASLLAGAEFRKVFCFVGVIAFLGYTSALWQDSIWFKRKWSTTAKFSFDGLVYAAITAGCFAVLWPKAA